VVPAGKESVVLVRGSLPTYEVKGATVGHMGDLQNLTNLGSSNGPASHPQHRGIGKSTALLDCENKMERLFKINKLL
jgi:hypothetical protein